MSHNVADLPREDRERYRMPFSMREIENNIPAHLREYFNEKLAHYREISKTLGKLPYEPKE